VKWIVAAVFIWLAWHYLRPKPKQRVVTDEAEARSILGLDRTADVDAIRSAHRRLTRRVNAARDLLLKRSR
jgi:DnaJ family protein C protein 19